MSRQNLKFIICYTLIIIILGSCASGRSARLSRSVEGVLDTEVGNQYFTGFFLYDPLARDTLYRLNSRKYFTPASNTKIFTLYTSLNMLPDHLPALKYHFDGDTLHIEGTGDPSALHPHFKDSTLLRFLRGYSNISFHPANLKDEKYGPGWAWEDYDWYYSPERTALPLYGNVVRIERADSLNVIPFYFRDSIREFNTGRNRTMDENRFLLDPEGRDTLEIPFRTSNRLTKALLEAELKKPIALASKPSLKAKKFLYGTHRDSVLKHMMHFSDNFLAEQLLILSSATIADTLATTTAMEFILETHLPDLKQPPRWVDGSGLSRYNLFSPESLVHVLDKLFQEVPGERLFHLFPAGGVSGTLQDWYPGDPEPYIYAKTGTLGNNHCLSGYLVTRSGRILIFSFMNNHFRLPNSVIKKRMQEVLETVRDNY